MNVERQRRSVLKHDDSEYRVSAEEKVSALPRPLDLFFFFTRLKLCVAALAGRGEEEEVGKD